MRFSTRVLFAFALVSLTNMAGAFAQDADGERKAHVHHYNHDRRDINTLSEKGEEDRVAYGVGVAWDSKYVSEGRDNLDDGGIFSMDGSVEYRGLSVGAWYAVADTVSYDELNLFAEYGFELGPVELYAGYTRLEFMKDDEYDNEISVGAALNVIPWLVPAVDYVYSTEAQGGDGGSFIEASLTSPIEVIEDKLLVEPYVLEGFDIGYASDNHDGFNNFQFGIIAHYTLTETLELTGSANHSIANQDVRKDGGGDESWVSLGVTATF